jgi:hypothetical protein
LEPIPGPLGRALCLHHEGCQGCEEAPLEGSGRVGSPGSLGNSLAPSPFGTLGTLGCEPRAVPRGSTLVSESGTIQQKEWPSSRKCAKTPTRRRNWNRSRGSPSGARFCHGESAISSPLHCGVAVWRANPFSIVPAEAGRECMKFRREGARGLHGPNRRTFDARAFQALLAAAPAAAPSQKVASADSAAPRAASVGWM